MKTIRFWVWAWCVWWSATSTAQVTQQVTALQYFFNADPGVGVPGNGAILPITPAADVNQVFNLALPGTLSQGFHQLYMRVKDEYGRWSVAERRMFYIADIVSGTRNLVAYQYYFDTEPGIGSPGNGAIVPISSTSSFNSTVAITLPGSLGNGFHQLYIRTKDDQGRWSLAERRMFYISDIVAGTRNIVSYQYYFDTDPGTGVAGNGAIVPVTSTADYNATVAITIPGSLNSGFHQLYIRARDDMGHWSVAERRMFYISDVVAGTRNITAYQYYFDTDPGAGVAGTGAIVPVTSTADYNATVAITIPGSLNNGFHQLYVRTKDDMGRWSLAERRMFYLSDIVTGTRNIIAFQYYFDADPGAGVAGTGAIVPVTSTSDYNATVAISLPGSLNPGLHQLYIRTKDDRGRWSVAERRMFYINDVVGGTHDITAVEYYFDADPGVRNANAYPVTATSDLNTTVMLNVPCLSVGTHYLFIRAKDTSGRWSIIDKDTLTITSGITPSVVSPTGPLSICTGGSVVLSTTPVSGVTYQWVESGIPIPGATNPSYTATVAGSYALRSICGSFVLSNTVVVAVLTQNTYYADADNDGYGNAAITLMDCVQPSGYVSNDDDCNDSNASIHPNAPETCNLVDDDCDGTVDEGVQTTFYADADNDGYGNPAVSQLACSMPAGFVANADDCNDANVNINPGATETCNAIDDDCDGSIDEGVQSTFYADTDGDGFGNPANSLLACTQPSGYVTNDDDCNDGNMAVNPEGTETCNGLDDDCDGLTDDDDSVVTGQSTWYADADGDGYGNAAMSVIACAAPAGYVPNDDDCDDMDMNINPGEAEICNGEDDDCDGLTDDADPSVSGQVAWYADSDADGFGDAGSVVMSCYQPAGYVANGDDCDDSDFAIHPNGTEVCNDADDDCNGQVDEGVQAVFYADVDNDGFGNPSVTMMACTAPVGYVTDNTDCDDALYYVYPGAPELCNGIDDDCDSQVDEGFEVSVAASSISSSNGESFCSGGSTMLSVVGGMLGTGADWHWYEGGCGSGTPLGTGVSLFVSPGAGTHTYYVRAEGTCNASGCVSIAIIVQVSPSFTGCPSGITASNDVSLCSAVKNYTVIASGSPAPAYSYEFSGATTGSGSGTGSGSVFNKGTTTVTITASNVCGSDVCTFDVNIQDTQSPVITDCPTIVETEVESGQWGAHISWTPPTATDNCAISSFTSLHAPGDFFVAGSTVVTYTATDESNNSTSCQLIVNVTPPNLVGDVNLSHFIQDISFSDNNPDPGTSVNVSAVVHNYSNVDAGNFKVRLIDMFSNTTYPFITIPSLGAGQSTQVNWVVTMPNVDAFVAIQITADVLDELDESNELDNTAVKPLVCGSPGSFGSVGLETTPYPAITTAGTSIQLCGYAFYENLSPPLADPSVAGAELTITILETGQEITGYTDENGEFCYQYDTPFTPGVYHYMVEVTDDILSGDAEGTFTLTEPPVPVCRKDLSVAMDLTGVYPPNSDTYTVTVGTMFSGTVHVKNDCQVVSQPTTLYLTSPTATGIPAPILVPALSPGQVYDVALPVITLPVVGTTYISATVDYNNVVAEDNEFNNTRFKLFHVLPLLPDLTVLSGSVMSASICQPSNQVSFVVKNIGPAASGIFTAVFEFYGNEILQETETLVLPGLAPGEETILVFPFTPAFLIDSFELSVDTPNVIPELTEVNNRLSFPYEFQPCQADIEVLGCEFLDVKPADPVPSGTLTATATLQNTSLLSITNPFIVDFNFAGTVVSVPVAGPLSPGQVIDVTASGPAPAAPGNTLTVTADPANTVPEGNEGNNSYGADLCYDFEFETLDCFGFPYFSGTQYYCNSGVFAIGVWNFGVYEAAGLQVKYEISGPGLSGWVHLGTISKYMGNSCRCPARAELPATFYFPQTGLYQVRMTLDPANTYAECNEANNQILMDLNVVESVDYKVLSSFINPSEINPDINEDVSFTITYQNEGCTGFSPMELYLEVDEEPLDSMPVSSLAGGGFSTVGIPSTWSSATPGVHIVRAIIDHDEQFSEGNELNNEATKAIIVGDAPDYHVVGVASTDSTPVLGQLLTLTAHVQNQGQSTGNGVLQFFFVDEQDVETLIGQQPVSILPGNSIFVSMDWVAVDPNSRIIARVINVAPIEFDFTDNEAELQLNSLQVEVQSTDVACAGIDLGSLEVVISGGKAPYYVEWSSGLTGTLIDVPSGTYAVTVIDASGRIETRFDTVMDLALPVTWYQDADNDGFGNPNVSDYDCVQPVGYVGTGTDCDDTKATVYPDAPEIQDGLDNDCDGLIDEGFSTLNVEAGDCETVYLGYVPNQCYTLSVTASGGTTPYTFLWSNGATISSTSVCPEETAIYSVTVTDHNGFTAEDNVTVQVIDIRCGNNNNKVLVCHIPPGNPQNVQMICIAPSAVQAHLDHGCYVGICDAPDPCAEEGQSASTYPASGSLDAGNSNPAIVDKEVLDIPEEGLTLVPNPADDYVMILYPLTDERRLLSLYDVSGRLIERVVLEDHQHKIQTGNLAEGIYVVQIQTPTKVMVMELVIAH